MGNLNDVLGVDCRQKKQIYQHLIFYFMITPFIIEEITLQKLNYKETLPINQSCPQNKSGKCRCLLCTEENFKEYRKNQKQVETTHIKETSNEQHDIIRKKLQNYKPDSSLKKSIYSSLIYRQRMLQQQNVLAKGSNEDFYFIISRLYYQNNHRYVVYSQPRTQSFCFLQTKRGVDTYNFKIIVLLFNQPEQSVKHLLNEEKILQYRNLDSSKIDIFTEENQNIVSKTKKDITNFPMGLRQFALARYSSEYNYNALVLNQLEFIALIKKKRIDKEWDGIISLQAYNCDNSANLQTADNDLRSKQDFVIFTYDYVGSELKQDKELLKQIINDMQNLNDQSDFGRKLWKEEQEQSRSLIKTPEQYMRYTTLKMSCFIEAFHEIQIIEMKCEFVKQSEKSMCLINISNLRFEMIEKMNKSYWHIQKIEIVNDKEREKIEQDLKQKQQKFEHDLNNKLNFYYKVETERQKKIKLQVSQHKAKLINAIHRVQEEAINQLNPKKQEEISNQAFQALNPRIPITITEILKNQNEVQYVQNMRYLFKNIPKNEKRYRLMLSQENIKLKKNDLCLTEREENSHNITGNINSHRVIRKGVRRSQSQSTQLSMRLSSINITQNE